MQPQFSEPQEYVITSTQDVNLFLAGVGSGKTHLGGFISGYLLQNFPKVFGFLGANTYQQLTTSTLYRSREVWKELFGWEEDIDYVVGKQPPKSFNTEWHNFDNYGGIISFRWGAMAYKGSLDNAKAHDGKEFGWAILDETKDSRGEDVRDTIMTRLRMAGIYIDSNGQLTTEAASEQGQLYKPFNPIYILTSPAKVQWINDWFQLDDYQNEIQRLIYSKTEFFSKDYDDKCVVISSTYHNEENLPAGYIDKIIKNQSKEGAKRLIYGNPFVKSGGEFYSGFDRVRHVRNVRYKPHLPIHISFDQNVVPYITATLYQIDIFDDNTRIVTQFDEFCLANPYNTTEALCDLFIKRYGGRCKSLFYYGDVSGRNRSTRGNQHDYDIIENKLRRWLNNKSDRVPNRNPPVIKRRDFINNIFENIYNIEFLISSECKHSIADFEFVKQDANGKKDKKKTKDPETGVTAEKYGHTSDSCDYFLCEVFAPLFRLHFK